MSLLTEGIWPCIALDGFFGTDDKDSPIARVNVQITEGPDKGRRCTYDDQVNAKSALYIGRSCMAVGWQGGTLKTLAADVAAFVKKTGGATTVEVRYVEVKKGKKFDAWKAGGFKGPGPVWDKVNSLGRGSKALAEPSKERLTDADDAMRAAMAAERGGNEPPPDDGGGYDDAPHAGVDDDIPFITCAAREPSPIAKVLR